MNIGSLLRPRNFKINTKEIGYIRPDKTINFETPEIAQKYAKNVIVRALNEPQPYEKGVFINGPTIVKEVNGSINEINTNTTGLHFDTMAHGHPDMMGKGKTSPHSADDIVALFQNTPNGATRSIVYNSLGEYAIIEKLPISKSYNQLPPNIQKSFLELKDRKELATAYRILDNINKIAMEKLQELRVSGKIKKFTEDIPTENFFGNLINKLNIYVMDEILKNKASELNITYKTNFSNLK